MLSCRMEPLFLRPVHFSTPELFAGLRELYPEEYELLKQDEHILGFTLDNKCDLDTFVGSAKSCVYHGDKKAIHSLVSGDFRLKRCMLMIGRIRQVLSMGQLEGLVDYLF